MNNLYIRGEEVLIRDINMLGRIDSIWEGVNNSTGHVHYVYTVQLYNGTWANAYESMLQSRLILQ